MEKDWIFQRCREVQEEPNGRIDIWARGHYKSTIITFGKTIQDILSSHGEDPLPEWGGREATIGVFSFNRPSAKKFLGQIKTEFENNKELKSLFPDILYADPKKESPKWSLDDGLVVIRKSNPRESTIEASGLVDGQPTGMHYLIRMYDDVVTLESARSSDMIKKTNDAWGKSLSLGTEGGFERYAGTFYTDGDSYCNIIERKGAIPRIYPATHDGTFSGKPVLFSQAYLDEKKIPGEYEFSCQYLCNPIPDINAYFTRDDFKIYEVRPKHLRFYGASDYALTEGGGDFTELAICGIDHNDDLYMIDWWSGQVSPDVWIEAQLDFVNKYKPVIWAAESGQIRRATEPFLNKSMKERHEYVTMEWFPTIADKPTMCRAFQARAKQGKIYLPNTDWAKDLISQLIRFPKGKYDDKADTCGLFGRMLDQMYAAVLPSKDEPREKRDSYGMDAEAELNWKTS